MTESPGADPTQAHIAAEWKYESPLIACRFDPQGRFVFATAEDNSVHRWTIGGEQPANLRGHDSWVHALALSPDGEVLVTGGCEGRLVWWNAAAEKPEIVRRVDAHQGWIRGLAMSPDGKVLASAGNDRCVRLWNAGDGSPIGELAGHASHVYSVLFNASGEFVISGELQGSVRQWKVADGTLVRTFDAKSLHSYNGGQGVDFGGVRSLALSPDGKRLACGGLHKAENPLGAVHEPLVLEFDWESQKLLRSYVAEGVKGVAWRVQYHPGDFLIGVSGGSSGGFLLFWKPDQDKEFHRFQLPSLARDFDLHPDGLRIATTHYDRQLRITRLTKKA